VRLARASRGADRSDHRPSHGITSRE
jgi:hypothetical protein